MRLLKNLFARLIFILSFALILLHLAILNNMIKLYLKLKYYLKTIFLIASPIIMECSLGTKVIRLFYVLCSPCFHEISTFYIQWIISDHVCICYQCLKWKFCLCQSIRDYYADLSCQFHLMQKSQDFRFNLASLLH